VFPAIDVERLDHVRRHRAELLDGPRKRHRRNQVDDLPCEVVIDHASTVRRQNRRLSAVRLLPLGGAASRRHCHLPPATRLRPSRAEATNPGGCELVLCRTSRVRTTSSEHVPTRSHPARGRWHQPRRRHGRMHRTRRRSPMSCREHRRRESSPVEAQSKSGPYGTSTPRTFPRQDVLTCRTIERHEADGRHRSERRADCLHSRRSPNTWPDEKYTTRSTPHRSAARSTCQVPSTFVATISAGVPAVSWASAPACTIASQPCAAVRTQFASRSSSPSARSNLRTSQPDCTRRSTSGKPTCPREPVTSAVRTTRVSQTHAPPNAGQTTRSERTSFDFAERTDNVATAVQHPPDIDGLTMSDVEDHIWKARQCPSA
jgi:hypothetical protein